MRSVPALSALLLATALVLPPGPAVARQPAPPAAASAALQPVLDYVEGQKTTGFLVIRDGKVLAQKNWPVPALDVRFRTAMTYGATAGGETREDVASQQKSFVAVLVAIAVDRKLLDVERPVSSYIGPGWSKASLDQEARIRVLDLLNMNSGLKEDFTYAAPPATVFLYNTPVYAVTKRVLAAAANQPLEALTRAWLTEPLGMSETGWRQRPAAMADVGNPTGLVTTPSDTARFGRMVLDDGRGPGGRRIVSSAGLRALFVRSATNPAYGRLWWLNGSPYAIRPLARRTEGQLIPAAPADLLAALGAGDRKLYVVPSRKLIVVRTGQQAPDRDFDQTLWTKLMAALPN